MPNKVDKIYESIDNAVLNGASKVAEAYNWVSGGTKLELANILTLTAPALLVVGGLEEPSKAFLSPSPAVYYTEQAIGSIILGGFAVGICYLNKFIEKEDRRYANSSVKSIYSKGLKNIYGLIANSASMGIPLGALIYPHSSREYLSPKLMLAGLAAGIAALHIMRTDYFPPKKNCVARTLDKVLESRTEKINS